MVCGCGSPEVCQGLSLSSSCPNLLLATQSHPHVIPKHSAPCGLGRHIQVCSADLISSRFISSLTPLLPGASPSGRGPAQIPAWTRSLLSSTQRIWLFFPPKMPVLQQQEPEHGQRHPDTSHWSGEPG